MVDFGVYETRSMRLFRDWLSTWSPYAKKCVLVYGSIGVGKTFTVKHIASELGYIVVEPDPDEIKAKRDLLNLLLSPRDFFTMKKKLVLLDRPYEFGFKRRDLIDFAKKTRVPLVYEDVDRKWYNIAECGEIKVDPPPKTWVVKQIKKHSIVKPCFKNLTEDTRQSLYRIYGSQGYRQENWINAVKEFFSTGRIDGLDYTHLPVLLDTGFRGFYGWRLFRFIESLVVAEYTGRFNVLKGLRPQFMVKDVDVSYYQRLKAIKEAEKMKQVSQST